MITGNIGQEEAIDCLRRNGYFVNPATIQLINDLVVRLNLAHESHKPIDTRQIRAYIDDKPALASALNGIRMTCAKDASARGCAGKMFIDLVDKYLAK